jgi:hypothetical protein
MQITQRTWQGIVALALVGMALMACSFGGSTGSGTSSGSSSSSTTGGASSSTTTSGGGSMTTTTSITSCNQLAAFAGAGAATFASSLFPAVSFPAGSRGYIADHYETNGYQYRILNYCTNGSTVSAIRAHFATAFPAAGYANTSIFPLHGNPSSSCGDPYCWSFGDAGPQYYAGLEVLSGEGNIGSVATYDIRLIIPPLSRGSVTIHDGDSFSLFTGTVESSPSGADFTMHMGDQIFADGTTKMAGPLSGTNLDSVSYSQLAGLSYDGNFVIFSHPGYSNTSHIFPFTEGTGTYAKVIFSPVSGSPTSLQVHWVLYGTTF